MPPRVPSLTARRSTPVQQPRGEQGGGSRMQDAHTRSPLALGGPDSCGTKTSSYKHTYYRPLPRDNASDRLASSGGHHEFPYARYLWASSRAICIRALDAFRPLNQVELVRGRWLALFAAQLRGSRSMSFDVRANLGESFARIDAKTAAAKAAGGFQCPSGCGKCCTSPFIEATEVECIPLALALIEQGKASAVMERIALAKRAGDATCVIYEPTNPDGSKGGCGMYDHRPGLCRLFGFSGRRSDQGAPEWSACAHMLEETSPAMEEVLQAPPPACMPITADELLQLRSSTGNPDEQTPLLLNDALGRALSKELTRAM